MKLNLPSTWTSEKITSLVFLTWLSSNQVNAGQAFKNCLASKNVAFYYDQLLNFSFLSHGESLCCDNLQCSSVPATATCNSQQFFCFKIIQQLFCEDWKIKCGGIIGNSLITTNSKNDFGDCPPTNLSNLTDYTNLTDYVKSLSPDGTDKGYAWLGSQIKLNLVCAWDNGGWTCINSDCSLQWPASWPGPADKNPYPLLATTASSSSASSSSSLGSETSSTITSSTPMDNSSATPLPNSHLTEKIAIPIGTTIGVGSAGGLAYYFWKKKKAVLTRTETNPVELLAFKDPEVAVQADSSTPRVQAQPVQIAQQVINPNQPQQVSINFTIPAWLNRIF